MQKANNKNQNPTKNLVLFYNVGLVFMFLESSAICQNVKSNIILRGILILTLIQPEKLYESFVFHEAHTYFLKMLKQSENITVNIFSLHCM